MSDYIGILLGKKVDKLIIGIEEIENLLKDETFRGYEETEILRKNLDVLQQIKREIEESREF